VPNHRSAKQRVRKSRIEYEQNRFYKTRYKNLLKRLKKAMEEGDQETVQQYLPQAISAIDKAAKAGAIHRNQAARRKSRLMKKTNEFTQPQS